MLLNILITLLSACSVDSENKRAGVILSSSTAVKSCQNDVAFGFLCCARNLVTELQSSGVVFFHINLSCLVRLHLDRFMEDGRSKDRSGDGGET